MILCDESAKQSRTRRRGYCALHSNTQRERESAQSAAAQVIEDRRAVSCAVAGVGSDVWVCARAQCVQ